MANYSKSLEDFGIADGAVGRLLPNQEVKLVDVDDSSLEIASPTQEGEICIRGPNIFRGYLRNTTATRAAFTSDGFFRTGDVGRLGQGGYLRITDRIKDLIKYKGFQVAPAELESILLGHPAVADVCVVGVIDRSQTTEVPRAYVVRSARWNPDDAGTTTDEEAAREIRAWADGRVAHHKKLRGGVHFVQQLPRTASGKILRRQIRVVEKSKL
jgi:4-coumarate--CoA ligase